MIIKRFKVKCYVCENEYYGEQVLHDDQSYKPVPYFRHIECSNCHAPFKAKAHPWTFFASDMIWFLLNNRELVINNLLNCCEKVEEFDDCRHRMIQEIDKIMEDIKVDPTHYENLYRSISEKMDGTELSDFYKKRLSNINKFNQMGKDELEHLVNGIVEESKERLTIMINKYRANLVKAETPHQ
jgi:hypothetical protein